MPQPIDVTPNHSNAIDTQAQLGSQDAVNGGQNPVKSRVDPALLSYLIISGGTGANSIASAFGPSPAFVLPVSDDGGSSSEILRCFGGPSIGDIRELQPKLTLSQLSTFDPLRPNS